MKNKIDIILNGEIIKAFSVRSETKKKDAYFHYLY